ncbi:PilZ domain-containing protein [uncultured Planococcus sp.]|uniref:PilZ domain-containing protein n=1 Tax=uncultured Planococcus sp. TaxID=337815 RepID=UPI0026349170|nr:PilZ domain-containing protein [uncultured Planococcus sp.]
MDNNRREFFRLWFDDSIEGQVSVNGGELVPVKIYNVSAGGLGFYSTISSALNEVITCHFKILEGSFVLAGSIVRKIPRKEKDTIEYGVEFSVDQGTSSELFKQLNYYQIRQRKGLLAE